MKILLAHNRYQFTAGEEAVVEAELNLLRSHGHDTCLVEVSNEEIKGLGQKVSAATSAIYSFQSKQLLHEKIRHFQPNVVHVHNFFPLLSPSVYDACRAAGVAVVQTLHNYRIICPKATLFRDGKVCEDCLGQALPWSGVVHRCYRQSRIQSVAVAAMITVHHLRQTWLERVDGFITLTAFQKAKMIQAGLPENKIYVKPNFIFDPNPQINPQSSPYALFVGRLWEEKGVATLVQAYVEGNVQLPLKIVGDGPLRQSLEAIMQQAGLGDRVEFLGWQEKSNVLSLLQQAQLLVFPSEWYETFGLSVIEAFACGVPVLASALGCMKELVQDGVTGLHFAPGNAAALAEKIHWAAANPDAMTSMGRRARKVYETLYTPEVNYQQLLAIYQQVQDGRN